MGAGEPTLCQPLSHSAGFARYTEDEDVPRVVVPPGARLIGAPWASCKFEADAASSRAMKHRVLRLLALLAAAVTVLMAVAAAIVRTLGPATPQSFNISSVVVFWVAAAVGVVYAVVGLVLARRLPLHPVPWLFTGIGLCIAGIVFTWAYAVVASSAQPPLPGVTIAALINTSILQPASLTLSIVLLFVFPDGRPTDSTSRRLAAMSPLAAALLAIGLTVTPASIGVFAGLHSPLAVQPALVGRTLEVAGAVGIMLLAAAGIRSLIHRYRAADDTTRHQIRWFLWAGAVGILGAGFGLVAFSVAPELLIGPGETLLVSLVALTSALLPIACAVGILRYRLYDIDEIISRTFVYGSLLALIAGGYTAGLVAMRQIAIALTGAPSDFSVVLITLVLAVSFEPVKRRLQKFAERVKEHDADAAPSVPAPDEAWIEAVAARVVEKLRSEAAARPVSVQPGDGMISAPAEDQPTGS